MTVKKKVEKKSVWKCDGSEMKYSLLETKYGEIINNLSGQGFWVNLLKVHYSKKRTNARQQLWLSIYKQHPEIEGRHLSYAAMMNEVTYED